MEQKYNVKLLAADTPRDDAQQLIVEVILNKC